VTAGATPQLTPRGLAGGVLTVMSGEDDKAFLATRTDRRSFVLSVFGDTSDRLTKESVLLNMRVIDSNR
jgi:hypothetical protein